MSPANQRPGEAGADQSEASNWELVSQPIKPNQWILKSLFVPNWRASLAFGASVSSGSGICSHRGTVCEYLLKKWRRGVEDGKLSPWHPRTRIHCPPNQKVRVLGVIHKWSFKKAVNMVKNVIVWFGMVRLTHRHVSGWFLTYFFCKTFVFLSKIPIPIPKKIVFPVLGCFVGYLKWQI